MGWLRQEWLSRRDLRHKYAVKSANCPSVSKRTCWASASTLVYGESGNGYDLQNVRTALNGCSWLTKMTSYVWRDEYIQRTRNSPTSCIRSAGLFIETRLLIRRQTSIMLLIFKCETGSLIMTRRSFCNVWIDQTTNDLGGCLPDDNTNGDVSSLLIDSFLSFLPSPTSMSPIHP